MAAQSPIATVESVAGRIHVIRRQKVMFDADLASLYGVTTKRFNEQVRRNLARFPGDFMFQLTEAEHTALRSQIATSNTGRGGRRYDKAIAGLIDAIRQLMMPSAQPKRPIGFTADIEKRS